MSRPSRRLPALVLLAGAALAAGSSATAQEPGLVPATPELCGDAALLCPDLVMAPPRDLEVVRSPSGRRVMRAENAIVNIGRGPMEVRTTASGMATVEPAEQVVRRADGAEPVRLPGAGQVLLKFVDRYRGSYWKYDQAARFELWTLDAAGQRAARVRVGPKLAYCLRDLDRVRTGADVPRKRVYPACSQKARPGRLRLGTSVGWADVYPAKYPENWIDVTGLRGCFAFVHRADPGGFLAEEREDNNVGERRVLLPATKRGGVRAC